MNPEIAKFVDLGTWIGRGQAFGTVANHCSYAQAKCLKEIRDTNAYLAAGLTWDEFCHVHAGVSRPRADVLIRNLEEFGEAYFRLSEIVRVSPDGFRQIAPRIEGTEIDIDGQMVPIAPENAVRIRNAIYQLRADLKRSREKEVALATPSITELRDKLDRCFDKMLEMSARPLPSLEEHSLRGLVTYSSNRLAKIGRNLAKLAA